MDEVAEHCSEQTVYHMLKSIVSKNNYLVSCLHFKLTEAYTITVDKKMDELTLLLFHPDRTALTRPCTSKSDPAASLIIAHVLALRAHLPHRIA